MTSLKPEGDLAPPFIKNVLHEHGRMLGADRKANEFFSRKLDKDDLIDAVKRVSIFSNKTTKQIQIQFSKNELTLSTQDKETKASAKEHIECEHVGEEIITQYNAQYLKEVLIHLKTEEIGIFLTSSQAAAVFKPTKTEDKTKQTALLMPLRSNS